MPCMEHAPCTSQKCSQQSLHPFGINMWGLATLVPHDTQQPSVSTGTTEQHQEKIVTQGCTAEVWSKGFLNRCQKEHLQPEMFMWPSGVQVTEESTSSLFFYNDFSHSAEEQRFWKCILFLPLTVLCSYSPGCIFHPFPSLVGLLSDCTCFCHLWLCPGGVRLFNL